MRGILLGSLLALGAYAGEYAATVEPYEHYTVAAATAGQVVFIDRETEGHVAGETPVIRLDDSLTGVRLEATRQLYENQKEIYQVRKKTYQKIAAMTTKTEFEKDTEKITMLSAQSTMLQTKENLDTLKDQLEKMTVRAKGRYIYQIHVNEGAYVNPGTALFDAFDTSRSKITVYVRKDEVAMLGEMRLEVDGVEGPWRIGKVWDVADSRYISAYKMELIGPPLKRFSQLATVRLLPKGQQKRVGD